MKLYLSSLMYSESSFEKIMPWIRKFPGRLGAEVFVMFHEKGFEAELSACGEELRQTEISFHEPYWGADHSFPEGTAEYVYTMDMIQKTICSMKELNARRMVFHHNNRKVDLKERRRMLDISRDNYDKTRKLCEENGITLVVENAGVGAHSLLWEDEFIDECERLECPVLIDIGHAFANGWNLEHVMESLQKQIVSYHIHNNDGIHDSHRRIRDGKLDFDKFLTMHKRYTPDAGLVLEYCGEVSEEEEGIEADIRFLLEHIPEN